MTNTKKRGKKVNDLLITVDIIDNLLLLTQGKCPMSKSCKIIDMIFHCNPVSLGNYLVKTFYSILKVSKIMFVSYNV